jgi:hypothetical protein
MCIFNLGVSRHTAQLIIWYALLYRSACDLVCFVIPLSLRFGMLVIPLSLLFGMLVIPSVGVAEVERIALPHGIHSTRLLRNLGRNDMLSLSYRPTCHTERSNAVAQSSVSLYKFLPH